MIVTSDISNKYDENRHNLCFYFFFLHVSIFTRSWWCYSVGDEVQGTNEELGLIQSESSAKTIWCKSALLTNELAINAELPSRYKVIIIHPQKAEFYLQLSTFACTSILCGYKITLLNNYLKA